MIGKEALFELLRKAGLSPEYYNIDENGFSRDIKFITNHVPCYIKWHSNNGYLSIEQQYLCYIPFTDVSSDICWPSYRKGLRFSYCRSDIDNNAYDCCWLAIDKHEWQEDGEKRFGRTGRA
jgi:hypothetical protein